MARIQDIVDLARESLNDDEKTRWPDDECLKYAQDGLDLIYQNRPDLFITQFNTFNAETLKLTSQNPVETRYRRTIADYIVMRCMMKDDEAVNANKAALANKYVMEMLMT